MQTAKLTTPNTPTTLAEKNEHKRLIRLSEVINLTSLCRATVYHYIKLGKSSLWEYSEIQSWINHCLQQCHSKALYH